jgi:hypothetical protein
MVFFSTSAATSQWQTVRDEDFETQLLNQPLRELLDAAQRGRLPAAPAAEALRVVIQEALAAPGSARTPDEWAELESLRLLASWTLENRLVREVPAAPDCDITAAVSVLSARIALGDLLLAWSLKLARSSPEDLPSRFDEWAVDKDRFLLSGGLSVERLQAFEALEHAMQSAQENGIIDSTVLIGAQWRLICSLIRLSGEQGGRERDGQHCVRSFLRKAIQKMDREWGSAAPNLNAGAAADLRQRLTALRASPLASQIPFEIWGALESVQSTWLRGSSKPPSALQQVKDFLHMRRSAPRAAAASASRQLRPVSDLDRRVARALMRKQRLEGTTGGDGIPLPLLTHAVGRQLFEGSASCFREKVGRVSPSSGNVVTMTVPLEMPLEVSLPARPIPELLFPSEILDPSFRPLQGPRELRLTIETEARVLEALTAGDEQQPLFHQVVADYILQGEQQESSWREYLIESILVRASQSEHAAELASLIERLQMEAGPQVQELLRAPRHRGQVVSWSWLSKRVEQAARHLAGYVAQEQEAGNITFSEHQAVWEKFLATAAEFPLRSWAQVQLLHRALEALTAIEMDSEAFDGALEALGDRRWHLVGSALQTLYGTSLRERAQQSELHASLLQWLQELTGGQAAMVGWGSLAHACAPDGAPR